MTQEQIKNLIQQLVTAAGSLLTLTGVMSASEVGTWTAAIMAVVGPAMVLGGLIYGAWTNSQKGLVQAVDHLAKDPSSPVAGVIVTPTKEGKELAASIPGNTTVPAGTMEASNIATSG